MNRTEFLSELRHNLRRIPQEEIENAVNYYEEFFAEAGDEEIAALGTPSELAAKIIGEYAVNSLNIVEVAPESSESSENSENPESKQKSSIHPLWGAILALCAAPIAFPIAIAVIAVVFSLGVTLIALVISFAAVALSGVAATVIGVATFQYGFATGLFNVGSGLLMFAGGAALTLLSLKLAEITTRGLQKWVGNLLIKRGKRNRGTES